MPTQTAAGNCCPRVSKSPSVPGTPAVFVSAACSPFPCFVVNYSNESAAVLGCVGQCTRACKAFPKPCWYFLCCSCPKLFFPSRFREFRLWGGREFRTPFQTVGMWDPVLLWGFSPLPTKGVILKWSPWGLHWHRYLHLTDDDDDVFCMQLKCVSESVVKDLGWPKLWGHERENGWKCSVKRAGLGSSPEPKAKEPELAYATISKESVISGQIPNSAFSRQEFPWVKKSWPRSYEFSSKFLHCFTCKMSYNYFSLLTQVL